jgi:two-component system alkaline phosphatase synthesis response regulator PhoP
VQTIATRRVMVVDDEPAIRQLVEHHLRREGFETTAFDRGDTAWEALERTPDEWDVLVLDVMLPGLDGFEICRRYRQTGAKGGVLLLTARDDEVDRVIGLEIGADDYITKPFSPRELVARVRAVLRRTVTLATPATPDLPEAEPPLVGGDIEVSVARHEVRRSGRPVELTPKEFDLLVFFLRHPNRVLSREDILRHVWGFQSTPDTRVVDTYVAHLRDKLEDNPRQPVRFVTVRGVGYKFNPAGRPAV